MSRDTLILLQQILGTVTLQVGAPDFEAAALRVVAAKRELDEELLRSATDDGQPE